MRQLLVSVCVTLCAVTASAQTSAPITGEVLTIYRQGSTTPAVGPTVLNRANITCGAGSAAPAPGGVTQNPDRVIWQSPTQASQDCRYLDPGPGVLRMLNADASVVYEATLRFRTATGDGPEGVRSNLFARSGELPGAPLRLRIETGQVAGIAFDGILRHRFLFPLGGGTAAETLTMYNPALPDFPVHIAAWNLDTPTFSPQVGDDVSVFVTRRRP